MGEGSLATMLRIPFGLLIIGVGSQIKDNYASEGIPCEAFNSHKPTHTFELPKSLEEQYNIKTVATDTLAIDSAQYINTTIATYKTN